ncbi:M20/M25/M40 family metallo-hydrolase [Edaphobacillus lindanitolerans]|uniref:Acetylornithine deacetylase/Succinyl-diaminopimelate desuccinylase n=1 Tax=Edaphobacillus lindanitolerans TaxID=550447 RepID=A0A1U7PNE5_9BACI|nr:M20/M25/M40 family metallo-hydrolase [Edaphobacillus lindanitolerans]SIT72810.1 Acetylornithine deacetylase/Succinyl-diaminopimelate desuccinylase [Edaphobacillus lindanitolerans]
MLKRDVLTVIEENRERYIEWLVEFCKIPSVAAQGRGMEEAVKFLDGLFEEELGLQPEKLDAGGYPVVYCEMKGASDHTISFYNHYDVQPEDPVDLWQTPAFEPDLRDGKIFARGVADNKGNLIARMAAVHAILQADEELPMNVKFVFEGEEEIGSVNLPELAEKHAEKLASDGCVWEFGYRDPDGTVQLSLGVKGMLYVELTASGASTDLHSANATIIENPLWRLVWALGTLKDPKERVLIPGFYDEIDEITETELALLDSYELDEDAMLDSLKLKKFVLGLKGDQLKRKHIFEPTCNICGVEGGYTGEGSKTVLPSKAMAKLDFRLVPGQDPQKILAALREHLDANGFEDIEIREMSSEVAARTHPDEALVHVMRSVAEKVSGKKPNVVPNTPGTGPMHVLCQALGIPSASFGVGNFSSNNHAPNENINVEDYIDGIKMAAVLIEEFNAQLNKEKSVVG